MRCPTHILLYSALLAGLSAAEAQNAPATNPAPSAASPSPSAASPAQSAASPAPSAPSSLLLYFDPGSATVRRQDVSLLDQASRLYRAGTPIVMIVTGSADTVGSGAANLQLSERRADNVLQGLVSRGIPVERFQVIAKGQTDPLCPPRQRSRRSAIGAWRLLGGDLRLHRNKPSSGSRAALITLLGLLAFGPACAYAVSQDAKQQRP
jgi:outer membrane protein OmpA-like peptidoglycan-associated protein